MKTLAELLSHLAENDIRLWLEGESLCCKAPTGVMNPVLKAELTERKAEIIDYLGTTSNMKRLPSRVSALRDSSKTSSTNVGIHALELYFPNHAVSQADMERFYNVEGKYTVGLGQEAITFCGDNEDAISMALTVVQRLMERHQIDWGRIGRLEVGTESLVDRSKSIKTHIMSLFGERGYNDIEGVDSYNACYGGTAALFNTIAWCQSQAWDGRYGLVVCDDIADLSEEQSFLNGAAAVAILVGADAPIVMQPERASHVMNTWDFYKPVGWKDSFPLMRDGKQSIDAYMTCLDGCQKALTEKLGISNLLRHDDYFIFHCTSTYLCKRGFDRLAANAEPEISLKERQALYKQKTNPSSLITKQIGSSYTASCYVNLCSLLLHEKERITGKTICVYSYGSGSAASAYRLKVVDLPKFDWEILERLNQRQWYAPAEFIKLTQEYSSTYGRFDFTPIERGDRIRGVYYLERVDEWGQRYYSQYAGELKASSRSNYDWYEGKLFPMQVNGSKLPFVFIHPGALPISCYESLVKHLGKDQPFYILEPSTLANNYRNLNIESSPIPISDVATQCIEALNNLQLPKPYLLGGWSLGGVVALEMANQLNNLDKQIELLAILDVGKHQLTENHTMLAWFCSYLGVRVGKQFFLDYDNIQGNEMNHLLEQAIKEGVVPQNTRLKEIQENFQIYKNAIHAASKQAFNHQFQIYPNQIELFLTDKCLDLVANEEYFNQFSSNPINRHIVPGDHYTMFLEPNVQTLAQKLKSCLDRANSSSYELSVSS
ncbi:MAG: hydroxymethylglutaryl-CoA synthase [Rivularia sp. (in: cyanobacteria)]